MKVTSVLKILTLFLCMPLVVKAQEEKWEKPAGGIENAQVVIEKDKIISLRPVSRRFKAIQIELPQAQAILFNHEFATTVDTLSSLQVIVRPKTMKDQPLEKLHGLNAKLGYGNYRSPFILLNAGNKRSDEYLYNLQFNHFSSGKGSINDAGYYSTRAGLDGKLYWNNVSMSSSLNFHNQVYENYGYDPAEYINYPDQDFLKQKLNNLSFLIALEENNQKNSVDQNFGLSINYLSNNHFDKEFILGFDYDINWFPVEEWKFSLPASFNLINQNGRGGNGISRHFASMKPVIGYTLNKFIFTGGANAFYYKDPINNLESKFNIFPNVGVTYQASSSLRAAVMVSGGLERITQQTLYSENLYLDSLIEANHNVNDFSAKIEIDGKLTETIGYSLGYQFLHYKRMMFYDNNPIDSGRFQVVYDEGGVRLQQFKAAINYLRNEHLNFTLSGVYNLYNTTDVITAWHKPKAELHFVTNLFVLKKLHTRLSYNLLYGIEARTSAGAIKTLDLVNDLNIGFDLEITERVGVFLDLRNIFGQNYQIYNNYPVNGFQFVAGIGIHF